MSCPTKFRIDAKGWFLTYPQCSLHKEEVLATLKMLRPGLKQVLVSSELHSDGHPHLHCYLYYETKWSCRNEKYFDIQGFHPNIQAAKSLKAVELYIKKDGDFIQEGMDYKHELQARQSHQAVLGKRFLDGEDTLTILESTPELFFQLDKIERCVAILKGLKKPTLPRCTGFIPNTITTEPLIVSDIKQRHYWFWSELPNKGKTTFLSSIQASFPSLWYDKAQKFQTASPTAQFVLLDEYSTGHLTVTSLNEMCDGKYLYPVKGSPSFTLDMPILLVCGNKSPLEIYHDPKHHELIKARFNIINID
nr:MAG: hypothetical protein [Crogonang virus 111]